MIKKISSVIICLLVISCAKETSKDKSFTSNIVINFNNKALPKDSIIYLQKLILDGGSIKLDSFKLNSRTLIIKKKFSEPFIGMITAKASNKKAYFDYITPQFIITNDDIKIKLNKNGKLDIVNGGENDFYKNNFFILYTSNTLDNSSVSDIISKYGFLPKNNDLYKKWIAYQEKVINLVKKNSDKYLLINNLYTIRNLLSDDTLLKCLDALNENFENTSTYNSIEKYLIDRKKVRLNSIFPKLKLKKENLTTVTTDIFKKNKEFYVVDFWASWCGPCRAQSRIISNNYSTIDTSKIQIISISTDKDINDWIKANNQEKIKWDSYVLDNEEANLFQYIPTYLVLNKDKKIIGNYHSIDSIKVFSFTDKTKERK